MDFVDKKIVVVGLGLMGGSIVHALHDRFPGIQITGVTRNKETLRRAQEDGVIVDGYTSIKELSESCAPDIIIIATPVQTIKTILDEIDQCIDSMPVVTDLGSTKAEIQSLFESCYYKSMLYVGSHPMTGSHNAGYEFSDSTLYKDTVCFVVKTSHTDEKALGAVRELWDALVSRVVVLGPDAHDQIVSRISHLPHAVSFALVDTVTRFGDDGFKYAGGGFKDFTRIAASDPKMWLDIFETNGDNIVSDLEVFKSSIESLIELVQSKDSSSLYSYFKHISDYRRQM